MQDLIYCFHLIAQERDTTDDMRAPALFFLPQ
jgi:hypothetical protein